MAHGDMIQIHMLTSYPATLLNRDDAGLAKRVPFGGVLRTRVSSQCLKKHWREHTAMTELGDMADRSTLIYERRIAEPLIADHGASEEEAEAIATYLMQFVDTKAEKKDQPLRTGQLLVLTRAETEFMGELAADILKDARKEDVDASDVKALKKLKPLNSGRKKELKKQLKKLPASIDTALFGRMVTSDYFARVDGAVSVAHAITTHPEAAETDYFTAVDTLKDGDDDAGAGLIQDTELTSGVFYLYAVVDMNQLRDNLGDLDHKADELVANLIRTMAMQSPGAKRGSTAPYAWAEFVLLERGSAQPRTLANAFRDAIDGRGTDLMDRSARAILDYRDRMNSMYGASHESAVLSTIHAEDADGPDRSNLASAIKQIIGGEA